jgi:NADH:ubiquinone oxidoreductase subunit 3 (subunit A)
MLKKIIPILMVLMFFVLLAILICLGVLRQIEDKKMNKIKENIYLHYQLNQK